MLYKAPRIVIERFWGLLCGDVPVSSMERNRDDSPRVWRDLYSARQLMDMK